MFNLFNKFFIVIFIIILFISLFFIPIFYSNNSYYDNTFEEKAQIAKNAGALACIIYNNVEGDILMSMGKSDHIPTISISQDDGV